MTDYLKSEPLVDELLDEFHTIYESLFLEAHHSPLFQGVYDFLKSWPHKLAVASNKKENYIRLLIENSPLKEFPWCRIIGGDTLTKKKPDPLPIFDIIKASKSNPQETVMVGDSPLDIQAAHAAQVRSIAVEFGYSPAEELQSHQPTAMISHYDELLGVLKKF